MQTKRVDTYKSIAPTATPVPPPSQSAQPVLHQPASQPDQHSHAQAFDFLMGKDCGANMHMRDNKNEPPSSLLFRRVAHKISHQLDANEKQKQDVPTLDAMKAYAVLCDDVSTYHYALLRLISYFMLAESNQIESDNRFSAIAAFLSFVAIANVESPSTLRMSLPEIVTARIVKELLKDDGNLPLAIYRTTFPLNSPSKNFQIIALGCQTDPDIAYDHNSILCHVDEKTETIIDKKDADQTADYLDQHLPECIGDATCYVNQQLDSFDPRYFLLMGYRRHILAGNNSMAQDLLETTLKQVYQKADPRMRFHHAERFLAEWTPSVCLPRLKEFLTRIDINATTTPRLFKHQNRVAPMTIISSTSNRRSSAQPS